MNHALWQFEVLPKKVKGALVLRFALRNNKPLDLWGRGKAYADFDIANLFKDETLFARATDFVASLGLGFPLPIGPKSAYEIFSLRGLPDYCDWELRVGSSYTQYDYQKDENTWWASRLQAKTSQELFNWFRRASSQALRRLALQDRAAYARSVIAEYHTQLKRLEEFYETTILLPAELAKLWDNMELTGRSFTPTRPRSRKK